jgi:hypothetical protein
VLVISLAALLEEAGATTKNLTGNVRSLPNVFEPGNVAQLEHSAKAFCFLAFHAKGDPAVTGYVREGTMADDSGPDVMVLFTLDEPAPIAVPVGGQSFRAWAEVGMGAHPAYQMVRRFFEGRPTPPLPGLLVLESLTADAPALYVPLSHAGTAVEVRRCLRQVFSTMESLARNPGSRLSLNRLGAELHRYGLAYERTESRSVREWLLEAIDIARQHYGDIVATIGLLR